MGQALYRKYRSKKLSEIVGQEHVTTTLANAFKQGKISHAYLLTGPRGVGKTSIARIIAHEINGLPYTDEQHMDIIEIDAASNRRIDEIRELRERVNIAPTSAKYKVYIIDEVHMLTKEAFNALLKTLEEPPEHVVFILATTEAHKLPETIVSRTQRYSLRPVPPKQVVEHLKTIAKGEKIKIDNDALKLIAQHGEGSFRDSISLLDQASATAEHVTRADVERILGLAPSEYIGQLQAALAGNDSAGIVTTLGELNAGGYEPAMVAAQLGKVLRTAVLEGAGGAEYLELLRKLLDIPAARQPGQLLELTLLQAALPPTSLVVPTPKISEITPVADNHTAPEKTEAIPDKMPETTPQQTPAAAPAFTADPGTLWAQTLEVVKKQHNTLYGIARMAAPAFDGQTLTLTFQFAFHQKRLNEAKNRKIFGDIVEQLHGKPVEIVCIIAEKSVEKPTTAPPLENISNIFGGAELLES